MKGVAIERWPGRHYIDVLAWLTETFGETSEDTWFTEHDFNFVDLVMRDDIYTAYCIKWGIP